MDDNNSTKTRPLPVLDRENHRRWFRRMEQWLRGKDLYRAIAEEKGETPPSTSEEGTKAEKRLSSSWLKADAMAQHWILQCISDDDQDLVEEETSAKGIWNVLKNKYTRDLRISVEELEAQFLTYRMDESTRIEEAWSHLTRLGGQIRAVDDRTTYHKPERRAKQILKALPPKYMSIRQTVKAQARRGQEPDHEEILLMLEEEERTIQGHAAAAAVKESAMASRDSGRSRGTGSKTCNLCKEEGHWMNQCPSLEIAQKHLRTRRSSKARSPPKSPKDFSKAKRSTSPELKEILKKLDAMSTKINALEKKQGRSKAFSAKDQMDKGSDEPPSSPEKSDSEIELAGSAAEARGDH